MSRGDYGGQRRNMEDDSMVGTLLSQAEVIWPKEREILRRRYGGVWGGAAEPRDAELPQRSGVRGGAAEPCDAELPQRSGVRGGAAEPCDAELPQRSGVRGRVLDLCCGTGEALRRLRADFAPRLAVGLDLFRGHLRRAERPVVQGDAFRTPFRSGSFDLVMVRHVLQALPDPVGLLREARRLLAPGGRLHLLVEDYAAILFDTEDYDTADHFQQVARPFRAKGTDLYQGRRAYRHLLEAGFSRIEIEPLLVDTLNSDRRVFADIFRYWRDGYAATLAGVIGTTEAEVVRRFDGMIETCLDPRRYAAWLLLSIDCAP